MTDLINKKKDNMFGILKSSKKVSAPKQSTREIIQQIHEEFYTEVDKLMEWAEKTKEPNSEKSELLEKESRLRRLGFESTKEVREARKEKNRLTRIREENREKVNLKEAINYFSQKYPQYKFITEESVQRICGKYGLVYGEVIRYEGTVPDKNLEQIEQFSIKDEDKCYVLNKIDQFESETKLISFDRYKELGKNREEGYMHYVMTRLYKAPLEIAAPQEDFNMKGYEVEGFKVVKKPVKIPDPVVLQPVIFKDKKHYLIVTAWGDEAADDLVVNEKMN